VIRTASIVAEIRKSKKGTEIWGRSRRREEEEAGTLL
jgi:hypothetical protein